MVPTVLWVTNCRERAHLSADARASNAPIDEFFLQLMGFACGLAVFLMQFIFVWAHYKKKLMDKPVELGKKFKTSRLIGYDAMLILTLIGNVASFRGIWNVIDAYFIPGKVILLCEKWCYSNLNFRWFVDEPLHLSNCGALLLLFILCWNLPPWRSQERQPIRDDSKFFSHLSFGWQSNGIKWKLALHYSTVKNMGFQIDQHGTIAQLSLNPVRPIRLLPVIAVTLKVNGCKSAGREADFAHFFKNK